MQIAYIILFTFSGAFWSNSIVDRQTFTTSNHGSDIFVLISHCSQPNTDKMTFVQVQELGISKLRMYTVAFSDTGIGNPRNGLLSSGLVEQNRLLSNHNLLYTMQDKISSVQVCLSLWTEMQALFLGLPTAQLFIRQQTGMWEGPGMMLA